MLKQKLSLFSVLTLLPLSVLTLLPLSVLTLLLLTAGVHAQTTIYTQGFESATAGTSTVTGMTLYSQDVVGTTNPHSGVNELTDSDHGNTFTQATINGADGNGGNVSFSAWFSTDTIGTDTCSASVAIRTTSTGSGSLGSLNGYEAQILFNTNKLYLTKRTGGGGSALAQCGGSAGTFSTTDRYHLTCLGRGTYLKAFCQRQSDGYYLSSAGWTQNALFLAAQDSTYAGAGTAAVYMQVGGATSGLLRVDDLLLTTLAPQILLNETFVPTSAEAVGVALESHTAPDGTTYTKRLGTQSAVLSPSGSLRTSGSTDSEQYVLNTTPAGTTQYLVGDFTLRGGTAYDVGLSLHDQSTNANGYVEGYRIGYVSDAAGNYTVHQDDAGASYTVMRSSNFAKAPAGTTTYRGILSYVGGQLEGTFLNLATGQTMFDAPYGVGDAALTGAGQLGFYANGAASDGVGPAMTRLQALDFAQPAANLVCDTPTQVVPAGNQTGLIFVHADGSLATTINAALIDGNLGGAFVNRYGTPITTIALTPTQPFNCFRYELPAAGLANYQFGNPAQVNLSFSSGGLLNDSAAICTVTKPARPVIAASSPSALTFAPVASYRPIALLSPFVQTQNVFGTTGTAVPGFTQALVTGSPALTVGGGNFSQTSTTGVSGSWQVSPTSMQSPAYSAEAKVLSWGGGGTNDQAFVGHYKDASDYVEGLVNHKAGTVSIVVDKAGTVTTLSTANYAVLPNAKITLVIETFTAALFIQNPADSVPNQVTSARVDSYFDFTLASNLAAFYPAFGTLEDANTAPVLTDFRAGHFGYIGIQNVHFPHDINTCQAVIAAGGKPYFIASLAGPTVATAGVINGNITQGVFTLDPLTQQFTLTALIYFTRADANAGGVARILGDGPGGIAYNSATGQWTTVQSSWSTGYLGSQSAQTVDTYWSQTSENLLTGVHFLPETLLAEPAQSAHSYEDPDIFTPSAGTYDIVCSQMNSKTSWSNYYPTLLTGSTMGGTFTQVWQNTGLVNSEGNELVNIGGTIYPAAGASTGSGTDGVINLMSLSSGTVVSPITYDFGQSSTSVPWGFGTFPTISYHPAIVAIPSSGGTEYEIVGFGGQNYGGQAWTDGDLNLYKSEQVTATPDFSPSTWASTGGPPIIAKAVRHIN